MTIEQLRHVLGSAKSLSGRLLSDGDLHGVGVVHALVTLVERANAVALAQDEAPEPPAKKKGGKRGPDTKPRKRKGEQTAIPGTATPGPGGCTKDTECVKLDRHPGECFFEDAEGNAGTREQLAASGGAK